MITIEDFVSKFAEQFEATDPSEITPTTKYKELDEWDSLAVLSIVAMVNTNYSVELIGADVRGTKTVYDLYKLVVSKM